MTSRYGKKYIYIAFFSSYYDCEWPLTSLWMWNSSDELSRWPFLHLTSCLSCWWWPKKRNTFSSWIGCYRIDVMSFFVITSILALVTVFAYDRVILAAYCMWLRLRLVCKPVVYDIASCVCISVDVFSTLRMFSALDIRTCQRLCVGVVWSGVFAHNRMHNFSPDAV